MRNIVWHLGKFLQLCGLIVAPYALYLGLSTQDARSELKLLLFAVIQFLIGVILVKWSSSE